MIRQLSSSTVSMLISILILVIMKMILSSGFARGSSKFRGVKLHKSGRSEARMGKLLGKK
ncbi:hypothetical protein Dimus_033519 [Dionaea muscipula]